jgi:hypothetical protein
MSPNDDQHIGRSKEDCRQAPGGIAIGVKNLNADGPADYVGS